jgi:hypothetical protein
MRRPLATTAAIVAIAGGLLVPLGACGSSAPTPSVASVNFTSHATIAVDGEALTVTDEDRSEVTTIPAGSVVTITNEGDSDQRVTGTLDGNPSIDSGVLHPGDEVTIVVARAGSLELWPNATRSGDSITMTVSPGPTD